MKDHKNLWHYSSFTEASESSLSVKLVKQTSVETILMREEEEIYWRDPEVSLQLLDPSNDEDALSWYHDRPAWSQENHALHHFSSWVSHFTRFCFKKRGRTWSMGSEGYDSSRVCLLIFYHKKLMLNLQLRLFILTLSFFLAKLS